MLHRYPHGNPRTGEHRSPAQDVRIPVGELVRHDRLPRQIFTPAWLPRRRIGSTTPRTSRAALWKRESPCRSTGLGRRASRNLRLKRKPASRSRGRQGSGAGRVPARGGISIQGQPNGCLHARPASQIFLSKMIHRTTAQIGRYGVRSSGPGDASCVPVFFGGDRLNGRRESSQGIRLTGTRRIDILHRNCDTGGSDGDT